MKAPAAHWLCPAAMAASLLFLASPAAAQGGPTPISLGDLLKGGWSDTKHYQLDPAAKAGADAFKQAEETKTLVQKAERASTLWESGKKMKDAGVSLYDKATQYDELMKDYQHLTPQDGAFDPNYTPPGQPKVPSSCAGTKACGQCFEAAYAKLNSVRVRFEKLRVIYGSTKSWINRALAFGDSAASGHYAAGLAWQTERRKVEASVANLDRSYDSKYAELLATLEESMRAIEVCEATHFKDPDWYDRFGFMFYTFMADRYRR